MSGNFITVTPSSAALMAGAADADKTDTTKITPRNDVADTDFKDIWWVGDYSDKNGATNGGFVAIHMLNSLSTGGFQIQSTNKGKGQFAFEFTGHYSIVDQNKVPYEVFVKAGNHRTYCQYRRRSDRSGAVPAAALPEGKETEGVYAGAGEKIRSGSHQGAPG